MSQQQIAPATPSFLRISDNEYLVSPFHTVPQLFINQPLLPRAVVEVHQEHLTHTSCNTIQFRLQILPMPTDDQLDGIPIIPNGLATPGPVPSHLALTPGMKILAWNCRCAARPKFLSEIHGLIDRHHPHILVLMDTRLQSGDRRIAHIISRLPYSGSCIASTMGSAGGGIWILWQCESVAVSRMTCSLRMFQLDATLFPIAFGLFLDWAVYNAPHEPPLQDQM